MRSIKFLEKVREKYELKNDAAVAKKLGVGSSAMSHYMNGRRVMDEETCLAVALALEIEPSTVLMAAGIDRAEKTGQRSLWEVFSRRTVTAAGIVLVTSVNLFLTPTQSEAAPMLKHVSATLYILVTDIGMPDVDGFELLRRVRALGAAKGGAVAAIALTAFARSEDRTKALRAGFSVHVSKPVEPSELIATVASVAGRIGVE